MKKRFLAFAATYSLCLIFGFDAQAQSGIQDQTPVEITIDKNFLPAEPGFARNHDCSDIDHRAQMGPYRNQGETGYCFAYTSAELIQHRTGVSVSALDLATTFYFAKTSRLKSTRDPILQEYLSSHPNIENEIYEKRMDADVGIAPVANDVDEFHPMFHDIEGGFEVPTIVLANTKDFCSDESFPSNKGLKPHKDFVQATAKQALQMAGPVGPEVSDLISRFRDPVADIFNTAWLRYIEASCKRTHSKIPAVPVAYSMARDIGDYREKVAAGKITAAEKARLIAVLDYALEHKRVATIGFDLSLILDPNSPEVQKWSNPDDPGDGDHSSLVVGRRKVNGKCQYLVRDPSGYDCKDYLAKFAKRCDHHHIWLKEDELLESFYDLVYLR